MSPANSSHVSREFPSPYVEPHAFACDDFRCHISFNLVNAVFAHAEQAALTLAIPSVKERHRSLRFDVECIRDEADLLIENGESTSLTMSEFAR